MILLNSTAFTGNIARDGAGNAMSVNTAVFMLTSPAELAGTGMENQGAATGWLSTTNAVTEGETVTLKFIVFDALDGTGDSLALIDGFTWHLDAPLRFAPSVSRHPMPLGSPSSSALRPR